jgi:predicted CoA-substrate-specific enzyme activase
MVGGNRSLICGHDFPADSGQNLADAKHKREVVVGLDAGSTGIKAALFCPRENKIIEILPYIRHHNDYDHAARDLLRKLSEQYFVISVNITGATGKVLATAWKSLNVVAEVNAHARGIRYTNPDVTAVLDAGGAEIKFFKIDEEGRTYDFAMNPECAAGSGSFLDQQAKRLKMSVDDASTPSRHLPAMGMDAIKKGETVPISGRCSVFAKSDMIHQQQKGVPDASIVGGLHESLVNNIKATVIQHRLKNFSGVLSFQGGLSMNESMVYCLANQLGLDEEHLYVHRHGYAMGAIGAALAGVQKHFDLEDLNLPVKKTHGESAYESLTDDYAAEKPDVKPVLYEIKPGDELEAYAGIDVGSVSTNVVLVERKTGEVLAKSYVPTRGRPIEAVRDGFRDVICYVGKELGIPRAQEAMTLQGDELRELVRKFCEHINILSTCTTGSGRFLTGYFMRADYMKNEITCQAMGAVKMAQRYGLKIDTIFEIGGQDSKYIKMNPDGGVRDYTMNKVCAAGCGSFLEEQAEKLKLNIINQFSEMALRANRPPDLGDRCTVFIESVLDAYSATGETKENLVAGLAYSVANNYLNRVVEGRDTEGIVAFQGGTAFNTAVVMAFQKILRKPVIVTPHNEVTGAIGAALYAMQETEKVLSKGKEYESTFDNIYSILTKPYEAETMVCRRCANRCELQVVKVKEVGPDGAQVVRRIFYGDRCDEMNLNQGAGRRETRRTWIDKRNELLFAYAGVPEKPNGLKIAFPRAMTTWSDYFPFWAELFKSLNYEVVVGPKTTQPIVKQGTALSLADFCLPIRLGLGAVDAVIQQDPKPDYVFVPFHISYPKRNKTTMAFACVWTQALPASVVETFDFDKLGIKLLTPVVELDYGFQNAIELKDYLVEHLGRTREEVTAAIEKGVKARERYLADLAALSNEALKGVSPEKPAFVIVGRSYNSEDPGISMDIAAKLERMGHPSVPIDFLPLDEIEIGKGHENMYWKNGECIISAFRYCREHPYLIPIWITNFSCGPDSFIRKQAEYVMGRMPYLELELDEHTADAGVITRVEAFYDSYRNTIEYAHQREKAAQPKIASHNFDATVEDLHKPGTLLMFSNMCDGAFPIAAAFRAWGFDALVLPRTDEKTLALGKRYSSGKECVPFQTTLGDKLNFIMNVPRRYMKYAGEVKTLERPVEPANIVFYDPFAQGPCRFGMYNEGYKRVYERLGLPVKILATGAHNNYGDVFDTTLDLVKFAVLALDGVVATDLLLKTLRLVRPLAVDRAEAEKVYYSMMRRVIEVMERPEKSLFAILRKRKEIDATMKDAAKRFAAVKTDPDRKVADVGMFGEIYVRSESFINEYLIETLEEYNIRTSLAPVNEWLQYVNEEAFVDYYREEEMVFGKNPKGFAKLRRLWNKRKLFDPKFRAWFVPGRIKRFSSYFAEIWDGLYDPETPKTMEAAWNRIPMSLRGEAMLSWGLARELQHSDRFAGIVNIGPFGCMPSKVVSVLLHDPEITKPVYDANYDGSRVSSRDIRVETFASQVWDYVNSHTKAAPKHAPEEKAPKGLSVGAED